MNPVLAARRKAACAFCAAPVGTVPSGQFGGQALVPAHALNGGACPMSWWPPGVDLSLVTRFAWCPAPLLEPVSLLPPSPLF